MAMGARFAIYPVGIVLAFNTVRRALNAVPADA
jgi:hypothetical protein